MIETEKKYLLTKDNFEKLQRIVSPNAEETYKEVNTLYDGNFLAEQEVLRIRKVSYPAGHTHYVVTYKGQSELFGDGGKSREEIEFQTDTNPAEFFKRLGYLPTISYEKKRTDHEFDQCVLSLDELPFGYYMEIEAEESEFPKLEKHMREVIGVDFEVESRSYPQLTKELWGSDTAKFLG